MKRREFFKYLVIFNSIILSQKMYASSNESDFLDFFKSLFNDEEKKVIKKNQEIQNTENNTFIEEIVDNVHEEKYIATQKEVFLDSKYKNFLDSTRYKLNKIQSHVGYGNFNIIGFDEILALAKQNTFIKPFTKEELEFLEHIFYYDPEYHGFYGERISKSITETIDKKRIIKVPYTGHYLFKDGPYETYLRMCEDIGSSLVLTSGIRSIVKQTKLFLDKLERENGNLSVCSKSIAPPAFTYHTISDFDVGKKGFGYANFTSEFALTEEFFHMKKLDYIDIRYTVKNLDGVRYEPWHVKII